MASDWPSAGDLICDWPVVGGASDASGSDEMPIRGAGPDDGDNAIYIGSSDDNDDFVTGNPLINHV